jgi:DNA-binding response OmpR family regulator
VQLSVGDDGPGIASEIQRKIFERFESNNRGKISKQPSTGIGLAVVKELVEMHHGTISVKSQPGKGTEFLISFPKDLKHYDKGIEALEVPSSVMSVSTPFNLEEGGVVETKKKQEKPDQEKTTILLVEDNREVRRFIKETLQAKYNVLEASEGEEGLQEIKKYQPDLIISDLMMSGMDGVAFLKEIRENIETSHIPFVILTAKSDLESKIHGFDQGADEYITKPFSTSYLMSRIENLLHQRKQLQQRFNRQQNYSPKFEVEPDLPHVTSMDEDFISKLKKFMEKNMDKSDLLVDDLALEMGVSRSVLFKKLKSLTGLAPIEFIRDMRLLRAAQLIETGQYNVKQIAVMVGITDSRYFSKCFKKKYGESPMAYKNSQCQLKEKK